MKKTTKFTLLFVLTIALLIGVLAALPLVASAAEEYTVTVLVRDENNQPITTGYVSIECNGKTYSPTNGEVKLPKSATYQLKAMADSVYYTFKGWKDNEDGFRNTNAEIEEKNLKNDLTLYAVYKPVEYRIYYVGARGVTDIPEKVQSQYVSDPIYHPEYRQPETPSTHVFGSDTTLPTIVLTTHELTGWTAVDDKGGLIFSNGTIISKDTHTDIYLIPTWTPKTFPVKLIDCVLEEYSEYAEGTHTIKTYTEEFAFASKVTYKNFSSAPETHSGYQLSTKKAFTEATVKETETVEIYRYFEPCTYTVKFDVAAPKEELIEAGQVECQVVYNEKVDPITVPQRTGYAFTGYFNSTNAQYFNADGTLKSEAGIWKATDNVQLTAKWEIQKHTVTITAVDETEKSCMDQIEINLLLKKADGTTESVKYNSATKFDYGAVFYMKITAPSGKKIAEWNEEALHTAENIVVFSIGEEDVAFNLVVLPVETTPVLTVNYIKETLEGFTPGSYQINAEEESWSFNISDTGLVTSITGKKKNPISIDSLFGKTFTVVRLGESKKTANSDAFELSPEARPELKLKSAVANEIEETQNVRSVAFTLPASLAGTVCEIAYITEDGQTPENWTTDLHFDELEAGTSYQFFLRVKATETQAHSNAVVILEYEFSNLVNLVPLLIVLSCILLLQVAALIFLLVVRGRANAKLNAVAAPLVAVLAIKLIPNGVFPIIIALMVAIVAVQAVLVALIVRTGVVRKQRKQEEGEQTSDSKEFTLFGEPTSQKPEETTTPAETNEETIEEPAAPAPDEEAHGDDSL